MFSLGSDYGRRWWAKKINIKFKANCIQFLTKSYRQMHSLLFQVHSGIFVQNINKSLNNNLYDIIVPNLFNKY